jgi:hypothetical protein
VDFSRANDVEDGVFFGVGGDGDEMCLNGSFFSQA